MNGYGGNGNGNGVEVTETDLDESNLVNGVGGGGRDEECFHCSHNPEKFLPLPKEKQPYCSKCFDSMFVGLSMTMTNTSASATTTTIIPPPPTAPPPPSSSFSVSADAGQNVNSGGSRSLSDNHVDRDNNNMSPPPPPPPLFTRPPTVPPKPSKGKPPILFSTLPQPYHSRSGSGSSGGSYSSTTGPVVAPSVPYTFTTPPTPPPPSPPPQHQTSESYPSYSGSNENISYHHQQQQENRPTFPTNSSSPLSFVSSVETELSSSSKPRISHSSASSNASADADSFQLPPPPPPFETDLDNVDDELMNSYSLNQHQNQNQIPTEERKGYSSPLPSRIYINSSTIRAPSPARSPSPFQQQQQTEPKSPMRTPPPSSPSFLRSKTTTTTTRSPAPGSPNLSRNSASGIYNNFNSTGKKFDYKTFASIPKPADDDNNDNDLDNRREGASNSATKLKPETTYQQLSKSAGSNHSKSNSSDSDSDQKNKRGPSVSYMPSTTPAPTQKPAATATGTGTGTGTNKPISSNPNPVSTIGTWVQKQQQQLQQQQQQKQQQQQQQQQQATPPVATVIQAENSQSQQPQSSSSSSTLKKSVSIEPVEETHLDQLNSIFKMSNSKDKQQRGDDPYRNRDFSSDNSSDPSLTRLTKPPITAAKPSFTCSKCKTNLLGKTVESKSGKVFCTPCYRNELANQPGCFKCAGSFTSETSLVTYKGQDWHADCFCCEKCKLPIGSKTFCNQKDGLFCADCYFESSGRKCVKCKKYLKSTGFLFRNEPWHHECFLCTTCNKPLGENQILCKDDQPYCATCYDQNYLEKCVKCHKILVGETVEYETQQYHDHCFCCQECDKPIGSTSFYPREGKVYCEPCFTQKYAKKCQKCHEIISPSNGFGLVYKQTHYHRQCFNCTNCSKSLANIAVHSTKTSDDPFCGDCYDEIYSKRCTSCNNIISGVIGSKFMSFEGRYWHVECFNCKLCQTSLENRKFFPSQGEMLCIACSRYNPYNNSQQ